MTLINADGNNKKNICVNLVNPCYLRLLSLINAGRRGVFGHGWDGLGWIADPVLKIKRRAPAWMGYAIMTTIKKGRDKHE